MDEARLFRVLQSRRTDYPEPIVLKKGEMVMVGEEYKGKGTWKGWIWCESPAGKGWVPYQIIEMISDSIGKVKEDYIATEMNVEKDELIEGDKELNGWVWGRNVTKNEYGWVPLEILKKEDS